MNPPNTTPLNEELDKIFGELIPVKWSTASYPIIPPKQLVHAKQELTKLIQTLEKKALDRILENNLLKLNYSEEYTRADIEQRLTQITQLQGAEND